MGAYGLHATHPVDNPHIIAMAAARTVETDLVLDIRNGPDAADRILGIQKDGEIWAQDGSATDPTYTFEDDIDSGFYRIGANNVGLALNGAKVVDYGTAGVAVTGTFSASGATTIDDTTDSTSITTGSLQTDGGLGVVKAAWIGGLMNVAGAVTMQSTLDVTGVSTLTGDVKLAGNILQTTGTNLTGISGGSGLALGANYRLYGESHASAGDHSWRSSGAALMRLTSAGLLGLGETANANMTVGLTINQGANDDHILAFKSSDVATGLTTAASDTVETDDYGTFTKIWPAEGGLRIQAMAEDAAVTTTLALHAFGGTAGTDKTTAAGFGLVDIRVHEHDGANSLANITADGNVFSISAKVAAGILVRLLVDEDGDLYSVTAAQTFDREDDLALVRALDLVRGDDVVRQEWDDFVRYNEADLIRLGILGAPISEGGMTNVTQLQRLHNGALTQLHTAHRKVESRTDKLESVLRDLLAQNPTLNGREQALKLLEA